MGINQIIKIDPEIMNGQPVFNGTRVPIDSLFDHLEAGISLDEYLEDFPTVTREQAVALKAIATDTEGFEWSKTQIRASGDI